MPGPDLTPLIARLKELGIDAPPVPDLVQSFEKCEPCRGSGRESVVDDEETTEILCRVCMGSGLIPDTTLAKWLKDMSYIMDKAYGRT